MNNPKRQLSGAAWLLTVMSLMMGFCYGLSLNQQSSVEYCYTLAGE